MISSDLECMQNYHFGSSDGASFAFTGIVASSWLETVESPMVSRMSKFCDMS
jgi:hypothetical protein